MVAHNTQYPKHRITKRCDHCGIDYDLYVCLEDVAEYVAGKWIQDAMPYLTDGERELILSGTCDSCFELIFESFEEEVE